MTLSAPPPSSPAPFGTVLGIGPGGVPVYSSDYASVDKTAMPDRASFRSIVDGEFMGYKWQCVELARRWLYRVKGYVFDDIAMAYDIFRLRSVRVVADGSRLPLCSFRNGAGRRPEPGSLLIWNEGGDFVVTGHVAVVTEVFDDRVRVIEQNVDNTPWPEGRTWSRELPASVSGDGAYWIEESLGNATILGWVIQTADRTHAEDIADADPRLFNPRERVLDPGPREDDVWLDAKVPEEAAYMAAMGGSHLAFEAADRFTWFRICETAERELRRATNELHALFLHATNYVLEHPDLQARFAFPKALWPRIQESWLRRRNQAITGRFDFSLSERGLKLYEYNADSASCHMESGRVHGAWARHFGLAEGRGAGEGLFAALASAWKLSRVGEVLHIMRDDDPEEAYHALFMKRAIEAAGIPCRIVVGTEGLSFGADGRVVDGEGLPVAWVWKTWSWETVLDRLREREAGEGDGIVLGGTAHPGLADVLLDPRVTVFEPLWTLVPSNKAILPILWMLTPNHPYLLQAGFDLDPAMVAKGYVSKPIVGRCGGNIRIFAPGRGLVAEKPGQFGDKPQIYQELFPMPRIGGRNVQVETFAVAGRYAGGCVRADSQAIIDTRSAVLPLRIVADADLDR